MRTAKFSGLVGHLGGAPDATRSADDGDLLARFAATRDEAAFAELVRRYGRLVYGVCRRVTGSHDLAEDAFQAVFVVLAAKAAAVRPPSAVGAWLHGVACRTALRARTMADRRRRREAPAAALPEHAAPAPHEPPDAVAVLDEEIARLPEHYRLPVVLCELEGHGRKDAAARLGIAEGTLSSRLAAARRALADKLRRRGIALSAAGLSAALAQAATASPPAALAAKAAATATAAAPELVPAPVAALSHGVLRIMFLDKLKSAAPLAAITLGVLACAALAAQPGVDTPGSPKPDSPKTAPVLFAARVPDPVPAKADPKPVPAGPNKILLYRAGHLTMLDPDGKNEKQVSKDRGEFHPGDAKLSPDGKRIAVLIQLREDIAAGLPPRRKLHVRGLDEKEPGTDLGVECQMFSWSPDGTEIACCDFVDGPPDKGPPAMSHFLINVKTKEKTNLKLPDNHMLTDWSRDGKFFLTTRIGGSQEKPEHRLFLMNRDGTEHKALTDEKILAVAGRLSPDGKKVLFTRLEWQKEKVAESGWFPRRELSVLDTATGKVAKVADTPLNGDIQSYCWSPDGKQIAYTWREVHEGKQEEVINKETESHLVVCDPDGKNAKTIATEKGSGQWIITIGQIDWR
jgi:RNA polymerase sigma factor (sigma-70 family)